MGSQGGGGPNGLTQRHLRTLFLRAPYQDWAALTQGYKTEFRARPKGALRYNAPTPVVLYAVSGLGRWTSKLMVLVEHRSERLVDIADQPESLLREGQESYDHFRRYWRARTRRPFRPLDKVEVFQLAPWPSGTQSLQIDQLGRVLLERLYGDYL